MKTTFHLLTFRIYQHVVEWSNRAKYLGITYELWQNPYFGAQVHEAIRKVTSVQSMTSGSKQQKLYSNEDHNPWLRWSKFTGPHPYSSGLSGERLRGTPNQTWLTPGDSWVLGGSHVVWYVANGYVEIKIPEYFCSSR